MNNNFLIKSNTFCTPSMTVYVTYIHR